MNHVEGGTEERLSSVNRGNNVQRLTGLWNLAPDPENRGREERWFEHGPVEMAQDAPVPGVIQQVFPDYHGVAWYWYKFSPAISKTSGERYLLQFGAVDYLAEVWLNGVLMGGYEGGETPFSLDITDVLKERSENTLVVRVLNPIEEPIDGIVLKETPHRNKKNKDYIPGSTFNYGGILQPVEVVVVPDVRIVDVFTRPDMETGIIRVTVTVRNDCGNLTTGRLAASIGPANIGGTLTTTHLTLEFLPGETVHELVLSVDQPHLWSIEDPYLYRVAVTMRASTKDGIVFTHEHGVCCGFRYFRVKNGYFYLNGKRIFLRSTHTINHYPIGQRVPYDPHLLLRDLIYAKACGFNMVRFIAGVAYPEQLDFCDEIGLMVYEESQASWCLEDSSKMAERYDRSTCQMILRDRNHPSVVIWGLLNETYDGPVFRHAHVSLPKIRMLDDTRLVLLNSGRWDCQPSIGSVSNPGSSEWEHVWGRETPGASPVSNEWNYIFGGYFGGAGDAHVYPGVPHNKQTKKFLRTLGYDTKPVFLSEYGIGSLLDVIHGTRMYEQVGADKDLSDAALFRSMADRLLADWKRFGMDSVYPFPEDMIRDSQRLHTRQRLMGLDLIRSNPKICGYNLTGMLDHGITGEGLWTFWREWKPGIVDVLADGFAPLRWCLFIEPLHAYTDRTFKIEAVLANEDVLQPGKYPVCFRIFGPNGNVWQKMVDVCVPELVAGENGPLALPALCEEISLDDAGVYELAVSMKRGGNPAGGRLKFYVSDPASSPRMQETVTLWGVEEHIETWLNSHNIRCQHFEKPAPSVHEVILIGELSGVQSDLAKWKELARRIACGSSAIFLSPLAFKRDEDVLGWLPLVNKGRCYKFGDWLYHKECVVKKHLIFNNLQAGGIMNWDYYGEVIPQYLFDGQDIPDDVVAAAFATGYPCPGGYASGILVGAYSFGQGCFILNTLRILENIDVCPAADQLLLNIISYARRNSSGQLAKLPSDFNVQLAALGYK